MPVSSAGLTVTDAVSDYVLSNVDVAVTSSSVDVSPAATDSLPVESIVETVLFTVQFTVFAAPPKAFTVALN